MSKTKQISVFEETNLNRANHRVFIRAKGETFSQALETAELVAVHRDIYKVTCWPLSGESDAAVREVMAVLLPAWVEEEMLDEQLSFTGTEG